ncbi:hypothetical protein CDL12_15882 [Handroanthus impetiginosus]|uniref:DUF7894 domain-containing protein n=1 Tax=Handroanthus impetiginosus TaxID=429701 RepID=A0A2G9H1Y8_9LAMI|nr:hypothetical protein CDL12_15882 [Handroanthus impetiginosus]
MKVADKVILLLNGGDGVAAALAGGLQPDPSSNFQTLNDSFELPLDWYGIKDRKASGEVIHFINSSGHYEVSILLLQKYEPPILACALNEILLKLAGENLSTMPTLIVPFIGKSENVPVYGIKFGPTTDVTKALSSRIQKSPPFLQIYHEELDVFLHLMKVMQPPTVVLIGLSDRHILNKNSKEEHEVICQIGEHLATVSSLSFSKEKMVQNPAKTSRDNEEAWRALYG